MVECILEIPKLRRIEFISEIIYIFIYNHRMSIIKKKKMLFRFSDMNSEYLD